jgi:hypothetical protein
MRLPLTGVVFENSESFAETIFALEGILLKSYLNAPLKKYVSPPPVQAPASKSILPGSERSLSEFPAKFISSELLTG